MFEFCATVVLGLVAGLAASHRIAVRGGRLSLRAYGGIILIVALELALVARQPPEWPIFVGIFLAVGVGMAVVDLAIVLGLDAQRSAPRLSIRDKPAARAILLAIPLVGALLVVAVPVLLFTRLGWVLMLVALGDILVRVTPSRAILREIKYGDEAD